MATKLGFIRTVALSICLLAISVGSANAYIIIDVPLIAKWIHESEQIYKQYIHMREWLTKKFNLAGNTANAEIQAMQNDAANVITRETQNTDALFNSKLKMFMQPYEGVCSTYNISGALSNYDCSYLSRLHQLSNSSANGFMSGAKHNGYGDTPYTYDQTKAIASLTPNQTLDVVDAANYENVDDKSLTSKQSANAEYFNYLIGPKPNLTYDSRLKGTLIGDKEKTKRLETIARAQAPKDVLNSVVVANESMNGGPSVSRLVEQSGQQFVINPKNIISINQGNKMSIDQVNRARAVAIAYHNYLLVQQYKSDLKKEFMYSNMIVQLQQNAKRGNIQ